MNHQGALADIRVLELTQVMAGPFCGQVLADMGADVDQGRAARAATRRARWLPLQGEDTAAFLAVNRNKRSSRSTSRTTPSARHFLRLARDRRRRAREPPPGRRGPARRRLRRRCARVNPRLVYASISGFGQTGPYAQRPGYDLIAQGARRGDERHRRARRRAGQVRASRSATSAPGCSARSAILRALHARERDGPRPVHRHARCSKARSRCRSGRAPSCGRPGACRASSAPPTG